MNSTRYIDVLSTPILTRYGTRRSTPEASPELAPHLRRATLLSAARYLTAYSLLGDHRWGLVIISAPFTSMDGWRSHGY